MKIKRFIQNQIFLVCLVYTLAIGIRINYVFQKQGMDGDEVLSVILSSYNNYGWQSNYEEDKIYTGKELKEITFFESGSIRNTLIDVYNLRKENRDRPHTNLYYSALRLWFTGQQIGNVHRIIVQGCLLNLLFFSLSFFFMYKLAKMLFKNKWIILLSLVVAFLSIGSISNTIYMRPYQLQETLFILFVHLFVYLWQKIELNKPIDSWQNLLLTALIVSLTLLSGYFAIFFIIPFGIFLLFKLYKEKQVKNIYFIIISLISAIVITFTLFPNYGKGFITYRGAEAIGKITGGNIMSNVLFSIENLGKILHENLFYTSVLLFLYIALCYLLWIKRQSLCLAFKNIRNIQPLPIILFVSLIWMSVIMILAPYKILRYIVPAIPLFSLLIPYIISKLNSTKIYILTLLFCLGKYGVITFNKERISFLFLDAYKEMEFNKKPEIPVIIFNNTSGAFWKIALILPYVADNQTYEFPHSDKSFIERATQYEKAILLIETSKNIDMENSFKNYSLKKFDFGYSSYFSSFQIVKKDN
jgi:hypothetical protein